MSDQTERAWAPDRAVTLTAVADVDAAQAGLPTCALCGQRAVRLDEYGLCSKTSEQHKDWRAGVRTNRKAEIR